MGINVRDEYSTALELAGFNTRRSTLASHLSEIEVETEKMLDLLTVLRSFAHHEDVEAVEETLAELVISLEHIHHHIQESLPGLEEQLDLKPE